MKKLMKTLAMTLALCLLAIPLAACGQTPGGANRLEDIKARGYLEVATEPYFVPMEFIDPSKEGDEKYVGADIELAKLIAERLGVELRVKPLEFAAVQAGVADGKYDMAISALAYTDLRAESMGLSKGYYYSEDNEGHGLVVRTEDLDKIKGIADLEGLTVVCQSGSLQEQLVQKQVEASVSLKESKRVSSTNDGLLSTQEGKSDVCVASVPMARLYIEANKDCGLAVVEGFKFELDPIYDSTVIGVPLGEDELLEFLNELIDEVLESGVYEQWYNEYSEYARNLGIE